MAREIKGHLKIDKVYDDHIETVYDDHNIIVSGMGIGLGNLFAGTGSTSILDYQIVYAQVGTGGGATPDETWDSLVTPAVELYRGQVIETTLSAIESGTVVAAKKFAVIPHTNISKVDKTSIRYKIIFGKESLNAVTPLYLNEIGLFMKNYTGSATDNPMMVAYKNFGNILKSTDFALVFSWTVTW